MWWVESTTNSSPIFQSTSPAPVSTAGLSPQLPVDKSVSSSKITQKLLADVERLEALVAQAHSKLAVAKQQGEAEFKSHSTLVRKLQRRHDDETASLRKKIVDLQRSQVETSKAHRQLLVKLVANQSKYTSQIEATEHTARIATENALRLRQEHRECLAQRETQAKMVDQQAALINDLQAEKLRLLDQLQQQQFEHVRQQEQAEQEAHSAAQELQRLHVQETRALQRRNTELEQSLAQSISAQVDLQAKLQQQSQHARQLEESEQKATSATHELQCQLEQETQALLRRNTELEQSLAQSISAQVDLQAKLQQQELEHVRQLKVTKQKADLATHDLQCQFEQKTQALLRRHTELEQSLAQSISAQVDLQAKLQQQELEHVRQLEEFEQKADLATQQLQCQLEHEKQTLLRRSTELEQSLAQSNSALCNLQAKLQQQESNHLRQLEEIEQKADLATQQLQCQLEYEKQALHQRSRELEQSLAQSNSVQIDLQAELKKLQIEHASQIEEIERRSHLALSHADLEVTTLRSESQACRENSQAEILNLKQLIHALEAKHAENHLTIDYQSTKLREQAELLNAATQRVATLEGILASEIAQHESKSLHLAERHQTDIDALKIIISELKQAEELSQRTLCEQNRLSEVREAEHIRHVEEVERSARMSIEHSQQQCLQLSNELAQVKAEQNCREKQYEECCAELLVEIQDLTQAVIDLKLRQTESQERESAQQLIIEQRNALSESLRIENERLSQQQLQVAIKHNEMCTHLQRCVEQESESRARAEQSLCALNEKHKREFAEIGRQRDEMTSLHAATQSEKIQLTIELTKAREQSTAWNLVERALREEVQSQAEQITNLQAAVEHLRLTEQHNAQAHIQFVEELRAELAMSQSLLKSQALELGECKDEMDELHSSLIDIKNALEFARREADENARTVENFRSQCFQLQNQLQKAAAARRKAESALFRATEPAAPNSIGEITRREIEAQQTVERLLVELKSTRLVCQNLKRNSNIYQEYIERLKSESKSKKIELKIATETDRHCSVLQSCMANSNSPSI